MKCKDCPYYWSEVDKNGKPIDNPTCHYQWNDGYAPCEVNDYDTPDIDE